MSSEVPEQVNDGFSGARKLRLITGEAQGAPDDSRPELTLIEGEKIEVPSENNINARVIEQQEQDGVDVGAEWFGLNVPEGSEDDMWDAFIQAYERDFPVGQDGKRYPRTSLGVVTRLDDDADQRDAA